MRKFVFSSMNFILTTYSKCLSLLYLILLVVNRRRDFLLLFTLEVH